MYGVELYAAVRLAVVDEGLSHHEAGRRFGIDRRTVKKMLSYAAPPGYRRPKPVRRPKLDGFTGIVDAIQQRVALARALVMRPQVLLLDEPLAALDLKLRQAMQEELRRIHNSIGGTFVFVTHDQGEALGLANIVAVMDEGVLAQLGSPRGDLLRAQDAVRFDLYRRGQRLCRHPRRRRGQVGSGRAIRRGRGRRTGARGGAARGGRAGSRAA